MGHRASDRASEGGFVIWEQKKLEHTFFIGLAFNRLQRIVIVVVGVGINDNDDDGTR